jgi:AcrR family transcriptional regulator
VTVVTQLGQDPRVARTRRDVLSAAREVLLEDGWECVTVSRVAERSGYARTTLYRHWPQRLDLLRDLIIEQARLVHTVPTGDLRSDLLAELEAFRSAVTGSVLGRVMIAVGQQALDDAEVADLNRVLRADGTRVLDEIIAAGVERGDLPRGLDAGLAVAQLAGPVLFCFLFERDRLDRPLVTAVVDGFLAAVRGDRG